MQVALIDALCPEPHLLVLDEPISSLDPLVRRELIRTAIGTYQEGDPENRTVFVSIHLITELESLIDEFTVLDKGKDILHMCTEYARQEFKKITAHSSDKATELNGLACLYSHLNDNKAEVFVRDDREQAVAELKELGAATINEEVFLTTLNARKREQATAQ